MGALARLDVDIIDLGLVRDDPAALAATLDEAIARADVVLTSGGVSVGDADYTKDLLASRGDVAFWKVAMRPGRPFAFGPLHRGEGRTPAWLFALPGNPVAALVTFYAFARDGLLQLAGARPSPLPTLRARCTTAIRKRPGRTEFQRAIVSPGADGQWDVRLTGTQGAGRAAQHERGERVGRARPRADLGGRGRCGERLVVRRAGVTAPPGAPAAHWWRHSSRGSVVSWYTIPRSYPHRRRRLGVAS